MLGQGNFGKVFLVMKKDTSEEFAMKVLRKDQILETETLLDRTKLEKEIMLDINNPFLMHMNWVF